MSEEENLLNKLDDEIDELYVNICQAIDKYKDDKTSFGRKCLTFFEDLQDYIDEYRASIIVEEKLK